MAKPEAFDVIVVGAGIAGAALAYELSASARVVVVERESQPGYHSTGRSAALFSQTYGNAAMRALARASRDFYVTPPPGFCSTPILSPRGALFVGTRAQREALQRHHDEAAREAVVEQWSGAQARARVPLFDAEQVEGAVWEADALDIDVHALHQGYLRGLKPRRGELRCNTDVTALERSAGAWTVQTSQGELRAPWLINAAGAWADVVAALAGATPLGLQALRRTVITVDSPLGRASDEWPAVIDVDEQYYFKPDAGRLLLSPADETPSPPCDAQPDEYDVALLVDRIEHATQLRVARIHSRWAGLRSFFPDRTLTAGVDPACPGFFWLAGQGGYGIQTASAAARLAAVLLLDRPLPQELIDHGVDAAWYAPHRLCSH